MGKCRYLHPCTNDIRMDNKNKDLYFFASDWTAHRVDKESILSDIGDPAQVTSANLLPGVEENETYKRNLKVLLGRVLGEYIEELAWMPHLLYGFVQDLQVYTGRQSKNKAEVGLCGRVAQDLG